MATPKFDDQLARFIQRGRKRRKNSAYKPAKQSSLPSSSRPAAFRPAKRGTTGY